MTVLPLGFMTTVSIELCKKRRLNITYCISLCTPSGWFISSFFVQCCTAKTMDRKFETNNLWNESVRPRSQVLLSCICERFINSYDRSTYFAAANMKVDRSWEYINCSQIYECGNWERGRAVSFLEIHKYVFSVC